MINAMQVRSIGGRIREIRVWRDMSLKATAELAGITESYLSRIERNERPVNSRSLLEAIAAALRVAPSELAGQAFPPATADPVASETQAAVIALDAALTDYNPGGAGSAGRKVPAEQHRTPPTTPWRTWAPTTAACGTEYKRIP